MELNFIAFRCFDRGFRYGINFKNKDESGTEANTSPDEALARHASEGSSLRFDRE